MDSHNRPTPQVDSLDEYIRLIGETVLRLLAWWPPNPRFLIRALDLLIKAIAIRYRLSGPGEAEAWKAAAAEVVEDIRHAVAARDEASHGR